MTATRGRNRPPLPAEAGPAMFLPYDVGVDETDLGGVVYHANHLRICDRVRDRVLSRVGLGFKSLWERQLVFAVVEARQRYPKPVRLGRLLVGTQLVVRGNAVVEARHVFVPDGTPPIDSIPEDPRALAAALFHAVVELALVTLDTGWPSTLPEDVRAGLLHNQP